MEVGLNTQRARTAERVLFAVLLIGLALEGFAYERFRDELPTWQLVGAICMGMLALYGAYRLAINFVTLNLE